MMGRIHWLIGLCILSYGLSLEAYDFPIKNEFLATLTTGLARSSDGFEFERLQLELKPERKHTFLLEGRHKIDVLIKRHQGPSRPVIFLIPGLGGTSSSGVIRFLGEKLFLQGYNVALLPSHFSWAWALGGSRSGCPGHSPTDAVDFFYLMEKVAANFPRPFQSSIVTFSMGGVLAPYLVDVDDRKKHFGFQRIVLINPPLDLQYSMEVLDRMYAGAMRRISAENRNEILGMVLGAGGQLRQYPVDQNYFLRINALRDLPNGAIQWIIAYTFRNSLAEVIFASQLVNDLGVLMSPVSRYRREGRWKEVNSFSFREYIEELLSLALLIRDGTQCRMDCLIMSATLESQINKLAGDERFYVIHNSDDFLVMQRSLEALESRMPERLVIYPSGGHGGNIWESDYLMRLFKILK